MWTFSFREGIQLTIQLITIQLITIQLTVQRTLQIKTLPTNPPPSSPFYCFAPQKKVRLWPIWQPKKNQPQPNNQKKQREKNTVLGNAVCFEPPKTQRKRRCVQRSTFNRTDASKYGWWRIFAAEPRRFGSQCIMAFSEDDEDRTMEKTWRLHTPEMTAGPYEIRGLLKTMGISFCCKLNSSNMSMHF